MVQPSRRLIVEPVDISKIEFPGPFGTVAFRVVDDVLYIYARSSCHPADWDVAQGLMTRIMHPSKNPAKIPSALAGVDYWSVEVRSDGASLI